MLETVFSAEELEQPILPDYCSSVLAAAGNSGQWYGMAMISFVTTAGIGTAAMGYSLAYCLAVT